MWEICFLPVKPEAATNIFVTDWSPPINTINNNKYLYSAFLWSNSKFCEVTQSDVYIHTYYKKIYVLCYVNSRICHVNNTVLFTARVWSVITFWYIIKIVRRRRWIDWFWTDVLFYLLCYIIGPQSQLEIFKDEQIVNIRSIPDGLRTGWLMNTL